MPHFLTRDEIYRVLQRELPDSVYADGAPSGALTTADNYSLAGVVADSYTNLNRIYQNKFPQTADEDINDWEFMVFGALSPASLTLSQRQALLVNYLRTKPKLSVQGMINVVTGAVPETAVSGIDISEWGCYTGGWVLDESELDVTTILNGENLVDVTGPGICGANPADYGKTPAEWALMQEEAYTYQVNIYGYTLSADQRATIDALLTKAEPARSTHVIVDGLDPDDMLNGDT